jgi:hypothetical protein
VTVDELIVNYPTLFHMAALGSWPSIRERGLLSTSALLDLYEVVGEQRIAIEARHRAETIVIEHPKLGLAGLGTHTRPKADV